MFANPLLVLLDFGHEVQPERDGGLFAVGSPQRAAIVEGGGLVRELVVHVGAIIPPDWDIGGYRPRFVTQKLFTG